MLIPFANPEALAKFLHRNYRAAFKALHQGGTEFVDGTGCKDEHDHGWKACASKQYFRRRASYIIRNEYSNLSDHMKSIEIWWP